MSPRKSTRRSSSSHPIASAQAQTLKEFEKLVHRDLKSVLGASGLKRLRKDLAICTSVGKGVVVQVPLDQPARFDPHKIGRKSEIVAVLGNTVPLTDPVSLKSLEPGVHAVAVRKISGEATAFDFFDGRGAPVLSTFAMAMTDAGTDGGTDAGGDIKLADIDVTRGGMDSLVPPGEVYICVSFLAWEYCFTLDIPTWWPW